MDGLGFKITPSFLHSMCGLCNNKKIHWNIQLILTNVGPWGWPWLELAPCWPDLVDSYWPWNGFEWTWSCASSWTAFIFGAINGEDWEDPKNWDKVSGLGWWSPWMAWVSLASSTAWTAIRCSGMAILYDPYSLGAPELIAMLNLRLSSIVMVWRDWQWIAPHPLQNPFGILTYQNFPLEISAWWFWDYGNTNTLPPKIFDSRKERKHCPVTLPPKISDPWMERRRFSPLFHLPVPVSPEKPLQRSCAI